MVNLDGAITTLYALVPESHTSHLRILSVYRSSHPFYLDLICHFSFESSFVVLLVFIWIAVVAIRRLGSGEWNNHEQEGEQEGLYNEGMPSHHIYLPVCKYACFIVLQIIYLIPVASVSTDTPTLILCRLLLDTLSRLFMFLIE